MGPVDRPPVRHGVVGRDELVKTCAIISDGPVARSHSKDVVEALERSR